MIGWSAATWMLAMAVLPGSAAPASPELKAREPLQLAQVRVRQQVIVRIPAGSRRIVPASPSLIGWREGRGPRCIRASSIVGASLLGQNSVDLILRNNSRIRARLETSCPALDYYYGFYISPNEDGLICADRDTIRSRMGGRCGIERFHTLRAVRRD